MRRKIISIIMVFVLLVSNVITCEAAGKSAIGLENNAPKGTSDAQTFVNGIKSKDSKYSVKYKSPSYVKETDFYAKNYTIKYWSSHGNNQGELWGTHSGVSLDIFEKSNFTWTGGNLEFVFLSACRQLDGSGSNPRKRYAKAMIGNKAVRVICGYHEQAPATIDKDVANKFIQYAKTGESVKSSWILANKYYQDRGYSTGVYCVLTHNGDVQYSRFPGFPGAVYARPGASSKTILRFSSANPNGVVQPSSVKRSSGAISQTVPNYVLKANPIKLKVKNNSNMKVLRDGTNLMMIGKEIGSVSVNMTKKEAVKKCKQELRKTISNYTSFDINSATTMVAPIVMAEVNMNGNSEKETAVAYDVTIKHTYDGIEIQGDYLSGVVSDTSTSYLAGNWSDLKKVKINQKKKMVDYKDAISRIKKYNENISKNERNKVSISDGTIVFIYNNTSGYYEPNWVFESQNGAVTYNVNCLNGNVRVGDVSKSGGAY